MENITFTVNLKDLFTLNECVCVCVCVRACAGVRACVCTVGGEDFSSLAPCLLVERQVEEGEERGETSVSFQVGGALSRRPPLRPPPPDWLSPSSSSWQAGRRTSPSRLSPAASLHSHTRGFRGPPSSPEPCRGTSTPPCPPTDTHTHTHTRVSVQVIYHISLAVVLVKLHSTPAGGDMLMT